MQDQGVGRLERNGFLELDVCADIVPAGELLKSCGGHDHALLQLAGDHHPLAPQLVDPSDLTAVLCAHQHLITDGLAIVPKQVKPDIEQSRFAVIARADDHHEVLLVHLTDKSHARHFLQVLFQVFVPARDPVEEVTPQRAVPIARRDLGDHRTHVPCGMGTDPSGSQIDDPCRSVQFPRVMVEVVNVGYAHEGLGQFQRVFDVVKTP